jgi:hypothetical protein
MFAGRSAGSLGFEKQSPQLALVHTLADLDEREVNGKYNAYSQCPAQDPVSSGVFAYILNGRVEVMDFMQRLQNPFNIKEQQTGNPIEDHFRGDRDDPAITLKSACKRSFVKYQRRLGGQQGADYGIGKNRYLDRKLLQCQLDERNQKQEADQKKNKSGPDGGEFLAQPSAYSADSM